MFKQLSVFISVFFLIFLAAIPVVQAQGNENLDDADISEEVLEELFMDKKVSAHLVDVDSEMGVVTLSGQVDNLLARDRAIELAKTVMGVRSVINQLEVKSVSRSDADILADVEKALYSDPATETYEIIATVDDGVVTIKGTVNSWAEKRLAESVVKGVRGVREVNNKIEIEYELDRTDEEIKKEIERVLEFDTFVDPALIEVAVDDGKVTLSGKVGSASEKSHAIADAWVTGVTAVDGSGLSIEWWAADEMSKNRMGFQSDDDIKQAIKDALMLDPRVYSFDPKVQVENGVVTLKGVVGNLKAKKAAEKDAENTIGVWRVKNRIRVRPADQPQDETITEEIKEAVARDPYLQRENIDVFVMNGKVYLSGVVDWFFKKSRAEDIASRVKGVIDVENNIKSDATWEYKSDWEIEQDVENELFWNPIVNRDAIDISVEDGIVTLQGTVPSYNAKEAATEEAYQAGAKHVRNQLELSEPSP
ncbi:BON domain-containing protein [candidate division KSB1 bacterium]|nr:BON domain-containing protein [candidate division KSB1 bacterium]